MKNYPIKMEEKMRKILPVIIILVLMFTTIGSVAPYPGAATAKIHPLLIELAARAPDQIVSVIVQKTSISNQAEMLTQNLGGKVTKDLHIINAFAAEMSAAAALQLSASPAVRWVSPDAPVRQSSDEAVFTTWATEAKTPTIGSFTNVSGILDSVNGPNDTYAYGDYVKAAFAGFAAELTPDYAISKVEVVLQAYAPAVPSADPILTISVAGVPGNSVVLDRHVFDNLIDPENAGLVVVDMTSTRTWQWSDFDPYLEITIDQSNLRTRDLIFYDAVGLRVTSLPGEDASEPAILTDETSAPINISLMNNVYNQVIGASQLWNEAPLFLQGNKDAAIAVVDSGVVRTKDLRFRIKKSVNFNMSSHLSADLYGHGTFVAGVIAGNGKGSSGKYIGVAPKATLFNVRVSDDLGMTNESDVISGLQWIYDHKDRTNIRVVNMSLNSSVEQSYHNSPLCAVVEILWFNGIVVVVSAGNSGTANLYPPANDPFVITVGATDDMGTVTLSDDGKRCDQA
jgi:hypothetical protein